MPAAGSVRAPPKAKPASKPAREPTRKRDDPTIQTKLEVGPVGDRFEREADRIAGAAVGAAPVPASAPPPVISGLGAQRTPATPAKPGPEKVDEAEEAPEQRAQAQRDAQTGAPGAAGGTAPAAVESAMSRLRSQPAEPLGPDLRAQLEPRLGADLGGVRLHKGSTAAEAAEGLGARAFTVGRDVVFGQGEYQPRTTEGQRLIAHEAVHTVQQQGGTARARRNGPPEGTPSTPPQDFARNVPQVGQVRVSATRPSDRAGHVELPTLRLPNIPGGAKGAADNAVVPGRPAEGYNAINASSGNFVYQGASSRDTNTSADHKYKTYLAGREPVRQGVKTAIERQFQTQSERFHEQDASGSEIYYLSREAQSSKLMLIGTAEQIAQHPDALRPTWNKAGREHAYNADHVMELQFGGKDAGDNMWLFDETWNQNQAGGPALSRKVDADLDKVIRAADASGFWSQDGLGLNKPSKTEMRRTWEINFRQISAFGNFTDSNKHWLPSELQSGEHVGQLKALSERELIRRGVKRNARGRLERLNIFARPDGGVLRYLVVQDNGTVGSGRAVSGLLTGFRPTDQGVTFTNPAEVVDDREVGGITGQPMKQHKVIRGAPQVTLPLRQKTALGFGVYLDDTPLQAALRQATARGASPITVADAHIDQQFRLAATGDILATKALFPELPIPLRIEGNDLFVEFPIPTDRLAFGPVSVSDASLRIGAGENGLFLEGGATIAVDQIGSGRLTARVERATTIIEGTFDLDLDFLDPARVQVRYDLAADTLSGSATLGVPAGRLPGVDSGTVTVGFTREEVTVDGSLALGGVLAGSTITVAYDRTRGLRLAAEDIPLPVARLPGVQNATLTVRAVRNPDDGTWAVSGEGSATLAAAGATGTLTIAYEGGAVTATGRAEVARGPASGWLQVTATNRQLDDEGNPVEDGTIGELSIFGRGEATIAFGSFLEGSAGLEYTADGRTIITGTIRVQPRPLFPERVYERELLRVSPPEFPIWGVSVAGIGVGIFAFVDAVVRFEARVGPGELRETFVTATIDLDRPQEATVEGNAQFFVPAYTGLTLDLGGGLRARLAVAYVQGRVGLDGTLGIEADASAAVNVRWNPTDGFALATTVEANARPKFRVGVNASVSAGVDVWIGKIEKTWGPWRRTLGEFGPDMEMGVTFPVAWSERDGLDLSLDNMTVRRPQLDAAGIMGDAFDRLV